MHAPKLTMDDTAVPAHVQQMVDHLQAEGKKVNVKISAVEYAKVMALPHEERLLYALEVMARHEQRDGKKPALQTRRIERRQQRRAAAKRARRQRAKG